VACIAKQEGNGWCLDVIWYADSLYCGFQSNWFVRPSVSVRNKSFLSGEWWAFTHYVVPSTKSLSYLLLKHFC